MRFRGKFDSQTGRATGLEMDADSAADELLLTHIAEAVKRGEQLAITVSSSGNDRSHRWTGEPPGDEAGQN